MNALLRWFFLSLGLLVPPLASADASMSFAPPPGDFSVVFLGNLFGIVGTVLHGNGSQIMGTMFGIFNSAVLALGGMIIMYTLLVSTLNTAHEGEMLGKRWSSIWVPMRSTLGLALLIPKASGYCLMQVFVMWVVLQGVGAADKIWSAALSYLNRGGTIVQQQMSSITPEDFKGEGAGGKAAADIVNGASKILLGQVCMLGLQTILEERRQTYLEQARSAAAGPCHNPTGVMKTFCDNAIPDFIGSVSVIGKDAPVNMPNFGEGAYAPLSGACGKIDWNKFEIPADDKNSETVNKFFKANLTPEEREITLQSRSIAIQQMYSTLAAIAQTMVNNDPKLHKPNPNDKTVHPVNGNQQFGVPLTDKNEFCATGINCVNWGSDPSWNTGTLFHGTEFQGALSDYNGTMRASLNLMYQIYTNSKAGQIRGFINQANREGWIMAGSYFFKLAMLSSSNMSSGSLMDTNSGLARSILNDPNKLIPKGTSCDDKEVPYPTLCVWMQGKKDRLEALVQLIRGDLPLPKNSTLASDYTPQKGENATSGVGFINNSLAMQLPGQPGRVLAEPNAPPLSIQMDSIQEKKFTCPRDGSLGWPLGSFCPKRDIPDALYNGALVPVANMVVGFINQLLTALVKGLVVIPLKLIGDLMQSGIYYLQSPSTNPIVALAQMGVTYINASLGIWFTVMMATLPVLLLPGEISIAPAVWALIGFMTPLVFAWLGVLIGIGFLTAYYIPFVPYMIFTFGTIAWFIVVIEAMVAAPIVALGVTHPEGEGAFGKGEQAIMILLNVFLRPSMMIIGYIAAIALTYVGVWLMNAGFTNVLSFMWSGSIDPSYGFVDFNFDRKKIINPLLFDSNGNYAGYRGLAGYYAFFFSSFVYATIYLTIVQRSFSLVALLPDHVLRWIGGPQESVGKEAVEWGKEAEHKVGELGQKTGAGTAEGIGKAHGQLTKKSTKNKRLK